MTYAKRYTWDALSLPLKAAALAFITLMMLFLFASRAGAAPVSSESTIAAAPATPVKIVYDDTSCSTCHYSDIQREHRARGGCTLCHKNDSYKAPVKGLSKIAAMAGKKSCGIDVVGCHGARSKAPWHGNDPARVTAAHTISTPASSAAVSCAGDGKGASCHATGSAQSGFYFGSMDIASAHADYRHAVDNDLTNHGINVAVSPAFTATADACGLCHDKSSTAPHGLKKAIAAQVVPAQKAGSLSCLTCHNAKNTYVSADVYPDALKALYPGKSLCFAADGKLLTPEPKPVTIQPAKPSVPSTPTAQDSSAQVGDLLAQLSPDLQAQLSGVTPSAQQQLTAGVLTPKSGQIPASLLPATSLQTAILFK
ncbi:MAG: hypothetical protein FWC54_00060 [Actinomycetia bacterium]|nr:hypothetical protein [Actinomycetes bacterium]